MDSALKENLQYLGLTTIAGLFDLEAGKAAERQASSIDFFADMIAAEVGARRERAVNRKIKKACFPSPKTLASFDWTAPEKINRELVQYLFRLDFMDRKENVVFIGQPGTGKTHLMTALGIHACGVGKDVLFAQAIDIINDLAEVAGQPEYNQRFRKYRTPDLLCVDEIGYLPIDERGADLFFQVISARYETGSTVLSSNLAYQDWAPVFAGNTCLTAAILDRIMHRCHTVVITGTSYRLKDAARQAEEA